MPSSVITAIDRIKRLRKRLDQARSRRDASPVDLLRIQLLLLKAQRRIAEALPHALPQAALAGIRTGASQHRQENRFA